MKHRYFCLLCAALPAIVHAELTLDGLALEPEWANAATIGNLVLTQPDSGLAPEFKTTVRYLA